MWAHRSHAHTLTRTITACSFQLYNVVWAYGRMGVWAYGHYFRKDFRVKASFPAFFSSLAGSMFNVQCSMFNVQCSIFVIPGKKVFAFLLEKKEKPQN
jgi:hypothetical protein